jgi:FtsZ-binding cell division protein ZapB
MEQIIEERDNACIERSPDDEIEEIIKVLDDVYKDFGDGRTLLRELVQNADDAQASRLVLAVIDTGWPNADNSLLRGPAFIVVNNGPFLKKDYDALPKAIGGSKTEEKDKVGRFGLGLKSVFHLCEAFLYLGADENVLRQGVLNPWAGTGGAGKTDPIHPDWDKISKNDRNQLLSLVRSLIQPFNKGLLLWIPLRLPEHLDRGDKDQEYGLNTKKIQISDIENWLKKSKALDLLLAQCGYLKTIDFFKIINNGDQKLSTKKLFSTMRPEFQSCQWIGRYDDDDNTFLKPFKGKIKNNDQEWSVVGIESLGNKKLTQLRFEKEWPRDRVPQKGGRRILVPRKSLAHASITILLPGDLNDDDCKVFFRWAVYFQLDDDPDPEKNNKKIIIEGNKDASNTWDIILNGYFWPSHDRRSIPGVTEDEDNVNDMRNRWNQAVRDEMLFPLLPSTLCKAIQEVSAKSALSLINIVSHSSLVKINKTQITKNHLLLPVIIENGIQWKAIPNADKLTILSVPGWTNAATKFRKKFVKKIKHKKSPIFIDEKMPRIGGTIDKWSCDWFKTLLDCLYLEMFHSVTDLKWLNILLSDIIGSPGKADDQRTELMANCLVKMIHKKALRRITTEKDKDKKQNLRSEWKKLIKILPEDWLVFTHIESERAVEELASKNVIGSGCLPVPLEYDKEFNRNCSAPDEQKTENSLMEIGKRLKNDIKISEKIRLSFLSLSESLLSISHTDLLNENLSQLPLIRASKLPDDKYEAWSIKDLEKHIQRFRVFSKGSSDEEWDNPTSKIPPDPKKAVMLLSEGIGEPVWLIENVIAERFNISFPNINELARAVIKSNKISSEPKERSELLNRLAKPEYADNQKVLRAIIILLTGNIAAHGNDQKLFYVRSQDSDKEDYAETLSILLNLLNKSWCKIEAFLVEPLPHKYISELQISDVDAGVLHELLEECLEQSVDWPGIQHKEAIHLLRSLSSHKNPEYHERWEKMPLHRGTDGNRGPCSKKSKIRNNTIELPPELQSEIRLLDPDPELQKFYHSYELLNEDSILEAMLERHTPHQYISQIIQLLIPDEGQVSQPKNSDLIDLIKYSEWLPLRNGDSGVSPEKLILLPTEEIQDIVSPLAREGVLGGYRLLDELHPEYQEDVKRIVMSTLKKNRVPDQIIKLSSSIVASKIETINDGAFMLLPNEDNIEDSLIDHILNSTLPSCHSGWSLVSKVAKCLKIDSNKTLNSASSSVKNSIIDLAKSFCGEISSQNQISTLNNLAAGHPSKDSPEGQIFYQLIKEFANTHAFFDMVLPQIELPTQDGNWHKAEDITCSTSGVARRHKLLSAYHDILCFDKYEPDNVESTPENYSSSDTLEKLESYFENWRDKLPNGAIGSLLSLLGNGKDDVILELSEQWIGEDNSVENIRYQLHQQPDDDPCESVRVFISEICSGKRVKALNLLGEQIDMAVDDIPDKIFATDPVRKKSSLGAFWSIKLRDLKPKEREYDELLNILGNTVEWWGKNVLKIEMNQIRAWWSNWGTGSQAQVAPVRASILSHLPLTLHQLDVSERYELKTALKKAQRSQRKREQAVSNNKSVKNAIQNEQNALKKLSELMNEPENHQFIWQRVQALIRRYGYSEDSILLELAQNADDALSQAAEIAGKQLPKDICKLIIRVSDLERKTIDIIHYGRPINDTGGASFSDGKNRDWDQDLYFMMLLNLSSKPGEVHGKESTSTTTGKFGLGFKSVHLVSDSPSIVSGFIAFSIVGGILPEEEKTIDDKPPALYNYPPTRIRLPLRLDIDGEILINNMFHRFRFVQSILPAFARELREIIVEGGPFPAICSFDNEAVENAPGWSVSKQTVDIPDNGKWHLLRYCPADAGKGDSTAAIVIGLKNNVPFMLPNEIPFLWNVTPTSENWGCGYAVNGPFKLDPGRTHVSLDAPETLNVITFLGEMLGKGLIDLHDALEKRTCQSNTTLPFGKNARPFMSKLWKLLSTGIDIQDGLRKQLLLKLHGNGRGVSLWMTKRPIVPSDLPEPFCSSLPELTEEDSQIQIEIADGGLDNPNFCKAISQITDLVALIQNHHIISNRIKNYVQPLINKEFRSIYPYDIFRELARKWNNDLTPERLHSLRPFADDTILKFLTNDSRGTVWYDELVARSASGKLLPLRQLLIPKELEIEADPAFHEEQFRAAFAPDRYILDPEYIQSPEDLTLFIKLRMRHEIDAAIMASWFADLPEEKRADAIYYLVCGDLHEKIVERIIQDNAKPDWLDSYDEVCRLLEASGLREHWQSNTLLIALFPDRFNVISETYTSEQPISESVKHDFFRRLNEWWNEEDERDKVIDLYEEKTWPDWLREEGIKAGLDSDSTDHWLGLLVLGACRSLGLAKNEHHRTFLENSYKQGWWDVFKNHDHEKAANWMKMLRDWQDKAVDKLKYSRWMALFPIIYQLSRYLDKYKRLLLSAENRPEESFQITCLLSPRVDETLTGAGKGFDAPPAPLNMGVHWILRELVRLKIIDGEHLYPYCWVPSEKLLRFLSQLGMEVDHAASNIEKAKSIDQFLENVMHTKKPSLHKSFDIPFHYIDDNNDLKKDLGLENE